eukprot:TRINITY_DN3880_c0_g1_i2.p1 TRINITY_DN3880_c0_g1~~TRINITY_DN3880_c0_g1_i2.p1  ORF type:complete len:312 (-),score=38.74 TRINITY_DN3880_c0_g1_i2:470-1405(-)
MLNNNAVSVKNTFISVDWDEDNAGTPSSRPRLLSDPTPKFSHSAESQSVQREAVGCDELDGMSVIRQEGCAETPFFPNPNSNGSARVDLGTWADSVCSSLEGERNCNQAGYNGVAVPSEWQGKSSVMVRNISYKCTRGMFRDELCKAGFEGLFDYVYVPVNVGRGTSKGYAFVNFVDAQTAFTFKQRFDGNRMDVPGGMKLLEVIPANLQGYAKNVSHYIDKQNEVSATLKSRQVSLPRAADVRGEWKANGVAATGTFGGSRKPSENVAVTSELNEKYAGPGPYCPMCGKHVLSKARFCQWCGAELHGLPQ